MAKWRKKPVVIEADVFSQGMEDGIDFADTVQKESNPIAHYLTGDPHDTEIYPYIQTLEGKHYICPGDYIITGIKGERYPCKPDIFLASYEPVAEPELSVNRQLDIADAANYSYGRDPYTGKPLE